MGRKPKLTEAQQVEARRRHAEGATLAELARSYGVGKSTISRLGREHAYIEDACECCVATHIYWTAQLSVRFPT